MSLSVFKKLGLTEVKDPLKAYLPKGESLDTGQDPNYGPSSKTDGHSPRREFELGP